MSSPDSRDDPQAVGGDVEYAARRVSAWCYHGARRLDRDGRISMRSIKTIGTVLLVALLAGGCGTTVNTRTTTVSVGQQLIDLQNAYKSGSMTKDQYQKAKNQLIDKVLD